MENLECPQCGSALANGVAVCGSCGKEVKEVRALPPQDQQQEPGRKNVYAILAVLLVLLGGAALLIFTGLLPNPLKGFGSVAAIVNGEKILIAEVDKQFDLYQQKSRKRDRPDSSTSEGREAAADRRMAILNKLINEKILDTEAAKEKITVSPQEIADIKKSLNFSDKDVNVFLKQRGMSMADIEKRIERDILIKKLIAKGTKENGLTRDAWFAELKKRAKVEILIE